MRGPDERPPRWRGTAREEPTTGAATGGVESPDADRRRRRESEEQV